jgi:hypothetical protein
VLTPASEKAYASLGAVQRRGVIRRPCPPGLIWNAYLRRCIRPL